MIVYVGMVGLLALVGGKFCFGGIHPQYLSKQNSNAVKGIFILLIFASHFWPNIGWPTNQLDATYRWFATALGQGVVTYMLFCSGYGVMLSADQKGESYMREFPKKRILATLLVYDCAQILFLFFNQFRGNRYSLKNFVLSMLAWETFGVDNWYIFVILGLYIISWLVLRNHRADGHAAAMITAASFAFIGLMTCSKGWYTTMLCYPLGMWYYLYKEKIEAYMKRDRCYFLVSVVLLTSYMIAHKFWYKASVYVITMLLFALLVIVVTMKFQINNRFLVYCGEHLQGLFLLHRIPMAALSDIPFMKSNLYLWFALSVAMAFFIEFFFHQIIDYIRSVQRI